jgi:hypothetical protein
VHGFEVFGVAEGGSVELSLAGETIVAATLSGDFPEDVAAALKKQQLKHLDEDVLPADRATSASTSKDPSCRATNLPGFFPLPPRGSDSEALLALPAVASLRTPASGEGSTAIRGCRSRASDWTL